MMFRDSSGYLIYKGAFRQQAVTVNSVFCILSERRGPETDLNQSYCCCSQAIELRDLKKLFH